MFAAGAPLIGMVDRDLALDLDLFTRGGLEILRAIEAQDYDVLRARPAISKWRKAGLLLTALSGKLIRARRQASRGPAGGCLIMDAKMDASKHEGRGRRRLRKPIESAERSPVRKPRIFTTPLSRCPRRSAMLFARSMRSCGMPTISRTMRVLLSPSARRGSISGLKHGMWLQQGGVADDPVFLALRDAQKRFEIPSELLEQLVEGTTMDLRRVGRWPRRVASRKSYDTYETFDELYRYCYLVASVVGLVCIRIFGYHDPRAEKLAEETGIAFQLTNILRDVREDAERGRIYLPLEDLRRFGVTPEQLAKVQRAGRRSRCGSCCSGRRFARRSITNRASGCCR